MVVLASFAALAAGRASADCDVAVVSSVHLDEHLCAGAHLKARVSDIGNLVVERVASDARALVIEVTAWRLEGFRVSADGKPLCIPEVEPCDSPAGHALLVKQTLLEPADALVPPEEWTWVLMLGWPEGAQRLEIGWVDAWR